MRSIRPLQRGLCVLLLAGAGCSFNFDQQYQVKSRRILGIQTDPPEIVVDLSKGFPANTPVKVKVLVVDPADTGAAVPYEWRMCSESLAPIAPALANWDYQSGRCVENTTTLAMNGQGSQPLPAFDSSPFDMFPIGLLDGLATLATGSGGGSGDGATALGSFLGGGADTPAIALWVDAEVKVDDGSNPALYGLKRMVVSNNLPAGKMANQIPQLTAVLFDYQPWEPNTPMVVHYGVCPDSQKTTVPNPNAKAGATGSDANVTVCQHSLTPVFDPSQSENYRVQTFNKDANGNWIVLSLKERLRFQWQSDVGSFDSAESEQPDNISFYNYDPTSVHWIEPPSMPSTKTMTTWVVIIDGRGGESWETRKVVFE